VRHDTSHATRSTQGRVHTKGAEMFAVLLGLFVWALIIFWFIGAMTK
jgi:hypothetical protein